MPLIPEKPELPIQPNPQQCQIRKRLINENLLTLLCETMTYFRKVLSLYSLHHLARPQMGSYNKNHRFTGIQSIYIRLTRCCCLLYKDDLPQMLFGGFRFVFCCVFVDFCSHRGRLEGLRPNQIVLMPMTWLPRDPILRFVFGFKLTLKGGVWRYYFYFYMGSPSMRFIKCCRWPKNDL